MNFTMSIWEARWCQGHPEFCATPPLPGWERQVYEEIVPPLWRRALAGLQPDSKGRYDGPAVLARLEHAIRATAEVARTDTQEAFLEVVAMPFEPDVREPAEPGCNCPACVDAQLALEGPTDTPRAERLREALVYALAFHLECVLKAPRGFDRRMGAPRIAWRRGGPATGEVTMVKQLRRPFLPSAKADPPCAVAVRQSNAACTRCGRAPALQWRCFYERIARTAWRLVTRPLTPSTRWPRGYYSRHLRARVDVVVKHLADGAGRADGDPRVVRVGVARPPHRAQIHQPASERRFYQPRENERYPWWPLREKSEDRSAAG